MCICTRMCVVLLGGADDIMCVHVGSTVSCVSSSNLIHVEIIQ